MADSIRVEVKGIKELQSKFKQIDKEIQTAIIEGLTVSGVLVVNTAQGRVAVKTGNLRDHIKTQDTKVESSKVQVDIGVKDVPYAARIEFGYTGPDKLGRRFHQKPQPYLRNTLDEKEKEIVNTVESKIKDVLGRYR